MSQMLILPHEALPVQPYWPDLAHLVAGTPAWHRGCDAALRRAGRPARFPSIDDEGGVAPLAPRSLRVQLGGLVAAVTLSVGLIAMAVQLFTPIA